MARTNIEDKHFIKIQESDIRRAKELLNQETLPFMVEGNQLVFPNSYTFDTALKIFFDKHLKILEGKKMNTYLSREDKEIYNFIMKALEDDIDFELIIDTLYFRFGIQPDAAIDTIMDIAVQSGIDVSNIDRYGATQRSIERIKKREAVANGLNQYGLTINQDVIDFYEARVRENPKLELFKHEILFETTLPRAQLKFMNLQELIADKDLIAVYRFLSSNFTSTHNSFSH